MLIRNLIIFLWISDDEDYDSSKEKERRRQFVREQKRKAKMRSPSVQDDTISLGVYKDITYVC